MNDETKDELMKRTREWLQSCVNAATRSGVPEEADLEAFILAHLDGEPARLAAAREEQREACATECEDGEACRCDNLDSDAQCGHCLGKAFAETVRATPLDATPLADELRTLRARVAELEAEVSRRDALIRSDGYDDMRAHAQELARRAEKAEAQVAAARAECLRPRPCACGHFVLRAMDEATKK